MPKIRVHELAKQLNVSSKEVIAKLEGHGASVSNFSTLEDADVARLTKEFSSRGKPPSSLSAAKPVGEDVKPTPPPLPEGQLIKRKPRTADEEPVSQSTADAKIQQTQQGLRTASAEDRPLPLVSSDGQPLQRRPRPVGEDGRPLPPIGPDGRPLMRKPRPLGPDGKPLPPVGPDGRPLMRKPRPLGPDGKPLPPVGPDGQPLKRRPRPLGPDGKPLPPVGPDGRPLQRKPRPVGEDGRPIPPVGLDGRPLQRKPHPAGTDGQSVEPTPNLNDTTKTASTQTTNQETNTLVAPPTITSTHDDTTTQADKHINTHTASQPSVITQPDTGSETTQAPAIKSHENENKERPSQGSRPRQTSDRSFGQDGRPPRTDGQRPAYGDRPPRTDGQRPAYGDRPPRTDGQRPSYGDRPPRTDGQRPAYGDRPPRTDGQRPAYGDRPPRTDGQRPSYGDRPPRADGQRPAYGDRPPRPDGQRPAYGDRPPRPDGQRPAYGGRSDGQRSTGGFPGRGGSPQGGRGPAGGPPRPGAPRPGTTSGKPDTKKGEPTKDDRKSQWSRSSQARSTQKDKNERKDSFMNQGRTTRQGRGPKPVHVKKVMPKMPDVTEITVAAEITVRDLAEKLHRSNSDIIKILMKKGLMVTANQLIDFETASHVAESFNVLVEEYVEVDAFDAAFSASPDDEGNLVPRPPVVVVMGHVDHGKTSLLDVIRSENVQASEAGGITQHIGAYSTSINGKAITFLDTPGHEAFTAMRMRGAQVTDIAILVVAADDGVMPQTIEAINHAKAAGIEIIVAINKMDKPGANPDRVKQELTEHGLQSEDWGGETITVPVSALQRTGIEQLLEMILLVAEMKELKSNPNKAAQGSIIEAKLDKGRGPVATVLVQSGTLKIGDPVVAGACFGKVRAMTDSRGRSLKEAGPSTPVEIIGLADVPVTGDVIYTAQSDKQARQLSETVVAKGRVNMIKSTQGKVSLDDLFNQIQAGQVKDLNIVVKADVQGSVEALRGSLDKLTNEDVRVRIIHTGVGAINESDVMLASASNAIIIGFNVRPDVSAKSTAETEQVDIRTYSVIYSAIDDIEAAMKGMLDPEFQEKILGHAEIRQIFKASSIGNIAGCYVTDGRVTRSAQIRLVRDGRVIYDGTLDALKRFKDDAREVASGYECGMTFKNYSDIKEGDKIEAYVMEEIPR